MALQPGDIVLDTTKQLDPAQLVKDGVAGISRYSAGEGNTSSATQWKLAKTGEMTAYKAAGLYVQGNCEWYQTRMREGRPAGLSDGRHDHVFWKRAGLSAGDIIRTSWDEPPAKAYWARAYAYLRGYHEGIAGRFQIGLPYAGTPFLEWLAKKPWVKKNLVVLGWRPAAGSWSGDGLAFQPYTRDPASRLTRAAAALAACPVLLLDQTGNTWYQGSCDENIVTQAWPPPAPAPKGRHRRPPQQDPSLTLALALAGQIAQLQKQLDAANATVTQEIAQLKGAPAS